MKISGKAVTFAIIAVLFFGVTFTVINLTRNAGKPENQVTKESAESLLERRAAKIRVNVLPPIMESVDLEAVNVADSLPDISKYPPQVESNTPDYIEIFSSVEKATVTGNSADNDRWLVDAAESFNKSSFVIDGRPVSVRIRGIASGLGMDYISSGKHVPDAFTPSNELWGDALREAGVKIELVEKKLVGNVAGIALRKSKNDEIIGKYGSVSLKNIIEAVAANELAFGYTNPFASSTGANFLISALYAFDASNPLSDEAVTAFTNFQSNIPFTAHTTLQMKDAASSGALDGFVFESQQFANSPDLRADYVFTPFGMRHDSPVYALGELPDMQRKILTEFISYAKSAGNQELASKYGFNQHSDYVFENQNANGSALASAQKLWKEKKSGNREVYAVFVADISGSMEGAPLNRLKESLISGSKYINSNCNVGLVTFSDDVNIALPIAKFDINQRSLFTGAVKNMQANGGTAMFDAIVIAEQMLLKIENPNAKLMLFVLSDGETNVGSNLKDVKDIIAGLRIPIYTIGYNANIAALAAVSSINEAASINADTEDVVYKIENLFNAEM